MDSALRFDPADNARRAQEAFDDAGYTLAAVTDRLGSNVFAHLSAGEIAPLVRATRAGDRFDVLVRLFLVGAPVTADDAGAALAPLALEAWAHSGVVAIDGDEVRGEVVVRPLGDPDDRLVVHDRPGPSGTVAADHVLGVSASTAALAGATIRRPVGATFDLGTGCGVQAIYAAAHSGCVVASDVNPRAVALAKMTMQLNGLAHVAVRSGDRFDPVAGERFDLIVANPPFVISPSRRYLFRDGGLPVDELCRSIVRTAPDHLVGGGHCQLLASWAHVAGEDWHGRLESWFAGTDCDAYVLEREALDPAAHAASWLRQTEAPESWGDDFDEWLTYCESHRIESVGFGLITMRKRGDDSPTWFRAEEAPQDLVMPCGDHLGAVFELADFLRVVDDDALLAATLAVAPDVVLDERARPGEGGWLVTERRLRQTAALCHQGDVDPGVAAIVAACDGQRTLGDVLAEVTAAAGVSAADMGAAAIPIIRRLIEQAFLLPAVPD
ncbi:MAG TPA: class I SAM-dependent methyltransferase [Desertimonas sp.]|nr:class I SAM-dependent methyltransferase [Desertimonas sp.]